MESTILPPKSKSMVLLNVKVPADLKADLMREADSMGLSLADVARMHLKQRLTFARYGA